MSPDKHPAARPNVRMTKRVNEHRKVLDWNKQSTRRRLLRWLHEIHGDPVDMEELEVADADAESDADAGGEVGEPGEILMVEGRVAEDPARIAAEAAQVIDPEHCAMPLDYVDALSEIDFRVVGALSHMTYAAARWEVNARHTGELYGVPATGREVSFTGMTFLEFEDDVPIKEWTYWELASLLEQIGAAPVSS
jgi:predicted ester cyclase